MYGVAPPVSHDAQSEAVAAVHVAHEASQPWQWSRVSAYVPSGHDATHEAAWSAGVAPAHEVQLAAPPLHVAQPASHAAQVVPESAYCPSAHWYSHLPVLALCTPPARHEAHPVALASVQLAQDASQATHALPSATRPAGQLATQAPAS